MLREYDLHVSNYFCLIIHTYMCFLHCFINFNHNRNILLKNTNQCKYQNYNATPYISYECIYMYILFYAALAKRWKVPFRQGFAYFNNNVDSKRHIIIRTVILYKYIYIQYTLIHSRLTVRDPAYSRILLSKFFYNNFGNFVNFLGHFGAEKRSNSP